MGRRYQAPRFQVLTAANSSLSPNGQFTEVGASDKVVFETTIASTVIGKFLVEYSNERGDVPSAWRELVFSTDLTANGASDTEYTIVIENKFKFLRLSFLDNGGSGLINAWVSAQGVGA